MERHRKCTQARVQWFESMLISAAGALEKAHAAKEAAELRAQECEARLNAALEDCLPGDAATFSRGRALLAHEWRCQQEDSSPGACVAELERLQVETSIRLLQVCTVCLTHWFQRACADP